MNYSDLAILLPTRNEEAGVGLVIDEVRHFIPGAKILVGDGGSTDSTFKVCEEREVVPLRIPLKGKGRAIKELIKLVETPYVVMLDSDFTYPACYILLMYSLLKQKEVDVVMGYRERKEAGAMPLINSIGNSLLSLLATILYMRNVYDVCTGMWGFKKSFLDSLDIKSKGFTLEAEFFVNAVKGGYGITQLPIKYRKRLGGSSPKLKFSDGLKIGWFLVRNSL